MKKIVQKESEILRNVARELEATEIVASKTQKILAEMKEALDKEKDGVAIAAPQIGYPLRIFVVSEKVAKIVKERKNKKKTEKNNKESKEEQNEKTENFGEVLEHTIFINPIMKKLSKEKSFVEEGCLSVRYLYGEVRRSNKAVVEACDENGKKFSIGGSGLLAQIFQHEIDHLNGILFIDKARNVTEIQPKKK